MTDWQHLVQQVAKTLTECCGIQPGDRLLLAVSGGADSVALVELLTAPEQIALTLSIAHVNHGLRGAESDHDQQLVRELASRHQLPFSATTVDPLTLSQQTGRSLEDCCRELRYCWLFEQMEATRSTALVVAHQADDQAETVLMRLIRGAGLKGLSAMPYRSNRSVIRPLLDLSGEELRYQLSKRQVPFAVDSSNLDTRFLRNRLRHQVLPLLADLQPDITNRLCQTAQILQGEESLLATDDQLLAKRILRHGSGWLAFNRTPLIELPRARRMRLYRLGVEQLLAAPSPLSYEHLIALDRCVLKGAAGRSVPLPAPLSVSQGSGMLLLLNQQQFPPELSTTTITAPGTYQLNGGITITITSDTRCTPLPNDCSTIVVDLELAPFPWTIRSWQPSDRMSLDGGGTSTVADQLSNARIPRPVRTRIPLIEAQGAILAVIGIRRSGLALVSPTSTAIARIAVHQHAQLPLSLSIFD